MRELEPMLRQVFGKHWQVQLCRLIKKDTTTVNRWARGRGEPPHWLYVLVWALVQLQQHGIAIPESLGQGTEVVEKASQEPEDA